ncbi:polysaccharide pyruvyl transferase family protein [Thermococcus sp. MAR1]|uniref:polysaccharide pyruvyl transferase family protein n=1 Tax=Thermococcus sp. MAR1 TaxID=1638263 RepID=UPI00143A1425
MVNILLVKTWKINIGNEIIENGAKALVNHAVPDAVIYEFSSYMLHVGYSKYSYSLARNLELKLKRSDVEKSVPEYWSAPFKLPVSLIKESSIDVAILPGCILDKFSLPRLAPILYELKKRNIPIILLGVGGNDYSENTASYVKRILYQVKPIAIITRDIKAYEIYSTESYIKYIFNGIDCGFFINDWHTPPKSNKGFVVLTFDKMISRGIELEKEFISQGMPVINVTHRPFNYLYLTIFADIFSRTFIEFSRNFLAKRGLLASDPNFLKRENIFMSDNIEDYLFLYSNALEVHSDRVHAIVASTSFDTPSWFYFKTPRAFLFENAGLYVKEDHSVHVKKGTLTRRKKEMVSLLRDILDDLKRYQ